MGKRKDKRKKKGGGVDQLAAEDRERRAELSQELGLADKNARRLRQSWREKLTRSQLPLIKEDVRIAWHAFEHELDNRDYSISILLDCQKETAGRKHKSDSLHAQQIDQLIELYRRKLLLGQEDEYRRHVQLSLGHEQDFYEAAAEAGERGQEHLRVSLFGSQEESERQLELLHSRTQSRLDTLIESNELVRKANRETLRGHSLEYKLQLTKALQDYESETADKRKDYDKANAKDEKFRASIGQQAQRLGQLQLRIQRLRRDCQESRARAEVLLRDHRFECDYFQAAYTAIQSRLISEQKFDKCQLTRNTMAFDEAVHRLNDHYSKIERILTVIELCRKYQTIGDCQLIYPLSSSSSRPIRERDETYLDTENAADSFIDYLKRTELFSRNDNLFRSLHKLAGQILIVERQNDRFREQARQLGSELQLWKKKLKLCIEFYSESTRDSLDLQSKTTKCAC
ncbi:uncharacterized protein LOC106658132 [Trichogramma pretiosum]|uniref:uncharacterized protein LOC106658132 n=1 Tax=Trichogramma pretiosum TaxID=7493 RepID=UPI0006C97A19|nr:uncharacterized protein LOC106658132 [Trichogramma pretiosum]